MKRTGILVLAVLGLLGVVAIAGNNASGNLNFNAYVDGVKLWSGTSYLSNWNYTAPTFYYTNKLADLSLYCVPSSAHLRANVTVHGGSLLNARRMLNALEINTLSAWHDESETGTRTVTNWDCGDPPEGDSTTGFYLGIDVADLTGDEVGKTYTIDITFFIGS